MNALKLALAAALSGTAWLLYRQAQAAAAPELAPAGEGPAYDPGGLDTAAQVIYGETLSLFGTAMRISDAGLAEIQRHEGFRATVYDDGAGYATIGYGHKLAAGEAFPAGVTRAEAEALLRSDVATAEAAVNAMVKVPLAQHQFDALVDFAFNVGAGNLARSTLLRLLNAGDYAGAAAEFSRWSYAGGRWLAGLAARRADEAATFQGA